MNTKYVKYLNDDEVFDLQGSSEYADYIMNNGDMSERIICNGDTLTEAMQDGYLFEEFLKSIHVVWVPGE